jgi:hypothetical protein
VLESAAVVLLVSAGNTGGGVLATGEARAGATLIGCAIVGVMVIGLRHLLPHIPRVNAPESVDV